MWLERTRPAVQGGHGDRAALRALALLVVGFGSACFKLDDDDCKLSSTCPGQTIAQYSALRGGACAGCMRDYCIERTRACDRDPVCQSAGACALQPDPGALQRCYARVLTSGPPDAGVTKPPWDSTLNLESCMDTFCNDECGRVVSDWSCIDDADYQLSIEDRSELVLYVSFFDTGVYNPAAGVHVSHCSGDPASCHYDGQTNEAGVFELGETRVNAGIYFKLESGPTSEIFPTTLFYPRPIEGGGRQPIAIYLVKTNLVGVSNDLLTGGDAGVLEASAQSIVLTDACRLQQTRSAPNVTIQIAGVPRRRCARDGQLPCVWYGGGNYFPDIESEMSIGTSSGVLGLTAGRHEIQACSDGTLVASRSVWMQPGWLTFARLWPPTERSLLGDDLSCPKSEDRGDATD